MMAELTPILVSKSLGVVRLASNHEERAGASGIFAVKTLRGLEFGDPSMRFELMA